MQTFIETEQKKLVKKFHVLLGKANIGQDGKEAILESYGVESSRDLSAIDLLDICEKLSEEADPKLGEYNKWRKRLMASIGGWTRALGKVPSDPTKGGEMIKAIACRAARRERFNDIPLEQLRSLYYAFAKKQKDIAMTEEMTSDEINRLITLN